MRKHKENAQIASKLWKKTSTAQPCNGICRWEANDVATLALSMRQPLQTESEERMRKPRENAQTASKLWKREQTVLQHNGICLWEAYDVAKSARKKLQMISTPKQPVMPNVFASTAKHKCRKQLSRQVNGRKKL
jgi:predicted kinase